MIQKEGYTMPHYGQRDFYIGVALYALLKSNKDARPSLIEPGENAARFIITTNTSIDFEIYIKYTKSKRNNIYWSFMLSDKDKSIINHMRANSDQAFIFFVLGEGFSGCEIAVLTMDEYKQIAHKDSLTIRLSGSRTKKYDIMDGKNNVMLRVNRNRIEKQLGHIKESECIPDNIDAINDIELTGNKQVSESTKCIQFFYKKYRKKNKSGRPRKRVNNEGQTSVFDFIRE